MSNSENAIEVTNLVKRYKDLLALDHFSLTVKAGEILDDGTLKVEGFKSTDEGVAFWCSVDGLEIYHAGDLNHWYWDGEAPEWNKNMTKAYREEIAKMHGRTADIAFLPLDPRLGEYF